MRVTKRQLKRIIREEKRKMREDCGDIAVDPVVSMAPAPLTDTVTESADPVEALMVEMDVAAQALDQVVESVQNAATLCHDCGPVVQANAPLLESVAQQVIALQETLEVAADLVSENAAPAGDIGMAAVDALDALGPVV
jgi:hypothetical protein